MWNELLYVCLTYFTCCFSLTELSPVVKSSLHRCTEPSVSYSNCITTEHVMTCSMCSHCTVFWHGPSLGPEQYIYQVWNRSDIQRTDRRTDRDSRFVFRCLSSFSGTSWTELVAFFWMKKLVWMTSVLHLGEEGTLLFVVPESSGVPVSCLRFHNIGQFIS